MGWLKVAWWGNRTGDLIWEDGFEHLTLLDLFLAPHSECLYLLGAFWELGAMRWLLVCYYKTPLKM